jgi:hypothetical protein
VGEDNHNDKKMDIVAQNNMNTHKEVMIQEVGDIIPKVEEDIFKEDVINETNIVINLIYVEKMLL